MVNVLAAVNHSQPTAPKGAVGIERAPARRRSPMAVVSSTTVAEVAELPFPNRLLADGV